MSNENTKIGIHIGAMCDSIHKQLKDQGIKIPASDLSHFQRAHDGFVQLRVLGCMGDKEADRIAQRLVSKLVKFVDNKMKQE